MSLPSVPTSLTALYSPARPSTKAAPAGAVSLEGGVQRHYRGQCGRSAGANHRLALVDVVETFERRHKRHEV
jgi:hypothetical protein